MSNNTVTSFDIIIVGSGHAGSCTAIAASDAGIKRILIVEKGPEGWVGGNGYFTAGAHRTVHGGLPDLLPLVTNVPAEQASQIDVEPYTAEQFTSDIMRLGQDKPDAALVKALVDGSRDAVQWLANRVKVPYTLAFNRQAYLVNGRQKFWGGLALSTRDGGKGLIETHRKALKEAGVETWFDTPAVEILRDGDAVSGLVVRKTGELVELHARAVMLACGGYEASRDLRKRYMGGNWDLAKVRGTPYNTGDGITLATAIGAALKGDFGGCHSTCWDANAPSDTGDRVLSNQFTKSGYPLGLMLNAQGHRFVDEGEDFRNYTYAKFGRAILEQPGGFAFQVWDSRATKWLRDEEYGDGIVRKIWADSIEELAGRLQHEGLEDKAQFIQTIAHFNQAASQFQLAHPTAQWDPAVKDGLSTQGSGFSPPKSNWAMPIEQGPFLAVKVACGITFTFGGLAVDPDTAGVLSESSGKPIRGLFCTGELVGGLFYSNYPGGSGLTGGAVFARKAAREAAKFL